MPDTQVRLSTGSLLEAQAAVTRLAESVIHLLGSAVGLTKNSTLAQLEALEATYDGYAPITMATWNAPILGATSGWLIYGPQVSFLYDFSVGIQNAIAGYWVETAGGVAVDLVLYATTVPMGANGQALVITPVEVFP